MGVNKAKQFKHTHHLDVNKAFTPLMRKVYNDQKRKGGGTCGSKGCVEPESPKSKSKSQSKSQPHSRIQIQQKPEGSSTRKRRERHEMFMNNDDLLKAIPDYNTNNPVSRLSLSSYKPSRNSSILLAD